METLQTFKYAPRWAIISGRRLLTFLFECELSNMEHHYHHHRKLDASYFPLEKKRTWWIYIRILIFFNFHYDIVSSTNKYHHDYARIPLYMTPSPMGNWNHATNNVMNPSGTEYPCRCCNICKSAATEYEQSNLQ